MDRIYLQGAEDVERAARNISGAADTMSRTAAAINETFERHAERQLQRDLRGEQHDPDAKTLRDVFAASASQGMLAGAMADGSHLGMESIRMIASAAFVFADAMLAARSAK